MNPKTFWANRATTIPGLLFLICVYLAQDPNMLAGLLPVETMKTIFRIASLVTGFVTFSAIKASNVSGNGSSANPVKIANSDGTQTIQPAAPAPTPPVFSQSKL